MELHCVVCPWVSRQKRELKFQTDNQQSGPNGQATTLSFLQLSLSLESPLAFLCFCRHKQLPQYLVTSVGVSSASLPVVYVVGAICGKMTSVYLLLDWLLVWKVCLAFDILL